jgi:hypothetical protein
VSFVFASGVFDTSKVESTALSVPPSVGVDESPTHAANDPTAAQPRSIDMRFLNVFFIALSFEKKNARINAVDVYEKRARADESPTENATARFARCLMLTREFIAPSIRVYNTTFAGYISPHSRAPELRRSASSSPARYRAMRR